MLRIAAQFIYKMKGELFATEELYPNCNTHWIMASEARRQFVPQPFFFTFLWILEITEKKDDPNHLPRHVNRWVPFEGGGVISTSGEMEQSHVNIFRGWRVLRRSSEMIIIFTQPYIHVPFILISFWTYVHMWFAFVFYECRVINRLFFWEDNLFFFPVGILKLTLLFLFFFFFRATTQPSCIFKEKDNH